jgi:hypothetical protein
MRPTEKANPRYLEALGELLLRIQGALGAMPKSRGPISMFIAGGTAVHCYTGARLSRDVDASFSRRVALPDDLTVHYRDPDGAARYLYLDTQYSDTLSPLHEDAHYDAVKLKLPGINPKRLDVRLLTPVDLAVSKLGRFSDIDRADIESLAREGLLKAGPLRVRAESALKGFVGELTRLQGSIDIACRLVDAYTRAPG